MMSLLANSAQAAEAYRAQIAPRNATDSVASRS